MKLALCPHFVTHVKSLDNINGLLVDCEECGSVVWPPSTSLDKGDWSQDPRFLMYAQHVRDKLIPMIDTSSVTISLIPPDNKPDVQYATQLGYMITLDKPIIVVATSGATVPDKLARIADAIVEGEIGDPDFDERLYAALKRVHADAQAKTQEGEP